MKATASCRRKQGVGRLSRILALGRAHGRAIIGLVSNDDSGRDSFEEMVRSIAREVSRSVERMADFDIDEVADVIGIDSARARELADFAARWLNGQAEHLGDSLPVWVGRTAGDDRPRTAGPHPLDLPTDEQGLALSALDSGRWTAEPGSDVLVANGEGPGPDNAIGLVGELRARDWIATNGELTLVGRNALARWLESANSR